jgi:hypothetical protein
VRDVADNFFLEQVRAMYKPQMVKGTSAATSAPALAFLRLIPVLDGVFGAMMQVGIVNDGPVTFILDSRKEEKGKNEEKGKAEEQKEKAIDE